MCVCVSECCSVMCQLPAALTDRLSSCCQVPCDWIVSMQVILPTNYLWRQARMDKFSTFKGNTTRRHRFIHSHTNTHTHMYFSLFCLHVSVSDVFFSTSLHFHTNTPHPSQFSCIRVFCLSLLLTFLSYTLTLKCAHTHTRRHAL